MKQTKKVRVLLSKEGFEQLKKLYSKRLEEFNKETSFIRGSLFDLEHIEYKSDNLVLLGWDNVNNHRTPTFILDVCLSDLSEKRYGYCLVAQGETPEDFYCRKMEGKLDYIKFNDMKFDSELDDSQVYWEIENKEKELTNSKKGVLNMSYYKGVRLMLSSDGFKAFSKNVKELLNLDLHSGAKDLLKEAEIHKSKLVVLVKWKDLEWNIESDSVAVLDEAMNKLKEQGYNYEFCAIGNEYSKHTVCYDNNKRDKIPDLAVEKVHNDEDTQKNIEYFEKQMEKENQASEDEEMEM